MNPARCKFASAGNVKNAVLPSNHSGTVYVRVRDTGNSQGNSAQDTVFIDQLYIRVDNTPSTPPADPSGLTANAVAHNQVNITWSDNANDETGYEVERAVGSGSFSLVTTLGANSASPLTNYVYRVRAVKSGLFSGYSNTASATTPDQPAVTLSVVGYKVRGRHNADLTWSGASGANVGIYRNNNLVATTNNDGAYTDNIGTKGAATYTYQVCEAGTSTCSNTDTIVF